MGNAPGEAVRAARAPRATGGLEGGLEVQALRPEGHEHRPRGEPRIRRGQLDARGDADASASLERSLDQVGGAEELGHEAAPGPVVDLGRRAALYEAAGAHDHEPIGQRERLPLVVSHGEVGEESVALEDDVHVAPVGRGREQGSPGQPQIPGRRLLEARDQAEQRGLAAPRGSHHARVLAGAEPGAHPGDRLGGPERLAQLDELEEGGIGGHRAESMRFRGVDAAVLAWRGPI